MCKKSQNASYAISTKYKIPCSKTDNLNKYKFENFTEQLDLTDVLQISII